MSDTSELLLPSSSIRTRVASMPRMIGRLAPAAKPLEEMPGMLASASAILPPPDWTICSRFTRAALVGLSTFSGEAVTTISGWLEGLEAGGELSGAAGCALAAAGASAAEAALSRRRYRMEMSSNGLNGFPQGESMCRGGRGRTAPAWFGDSGLEVERRRPAAPDMGTPRGRRGDRRGDLAGVEDRLGRVEDERR